MTNVVTAGVIRLEAAGLSEVFAWRRWRDPQPGAAVIVLSAADDWSSTRTSALLPQLQAQVYAAPTEGQADAEAIALRVADKVRQALHRVAGGFEWWGDARVLSSQHVGSSLAEVEGHEDWRVRGLVFEVQTG
jgi:hypothetical protein